MTHPNDERDERVRQIRDERAALDRMDVSVNWLHQAYREHVDYLLSRLDSQAAPIVHRNYECMTTVADETLWCPTCAAHAEYLRGYATAATRMRDRCVAKVREATPEIVACRPHSQIGDLMSRLIAKLEQEKL